MDLLTDIVSGLEPRSSLYFRAAFSARFAVAVPEDRRRIRFHVAGSGRSWVGLDSGESAFYHEGDLVLVPHGRAHVLASGPGEAPAPLHAVLAENPIGPDGVLRHGGGGALAELVCGHFAFDESSMHPLVESLPPLLHLRADAGAGFAWLPPLLEAVERERHSDAAGNEAVVRRLSEILFIQVLRAAQTHGALGPGVLASIDDAQLGRALRAIHAEPARDWSLAELATRAGLSRSVFAERFRKRIGATPMRYLADWRMRSARRLLRDPALSVGEVGRRVGYASEAAFNHAFRESVGEPPGRHRRALRSASA